MKDKLLSHSSLMAIFLIIRVLGNTGKYCTIDRRYTLNSTLDKIIQCKAQLHEKIMKNGLSRYSE